MWIQADSEVNRIEILYPGHADAAGKSGNSLSGSAVGGSGFDHGPGGNAYTGASGRTHGGNVINEGGGIRNAVDLTCKSAMTAYYAFKADI